MRKLLLSAALVGALTLAVGAMAASAATNYSLFGDAQLVSPGEASSAHAVEATSSGTHAFGGVDLGVPAGINTIADLTNLSTDYKFTQGSCGLGSPRFAVEVNNDPDTNLFFYIGPPPNYTGCTSGTWTASGNLADPGNVVDATQLGGTFFESYADVVQAFGSDPVTDIALVVDGPAQTVQFDNSLVNATAYSYDPTCTHTGFVRDGIDLTAAQIGGDVTGELDATGCNIGVYYDSTHTGNVTDADIHGANYFGVVVNGTAVNVTGSSLHDIGENPLNGTQHGNAVAYLDGASGTISGNTIFSYQKNGIKVVDAGTSTSILDNTVTGEGPVTYIAQNGIEVGLGAAANVSGNTVSENAYSGTNDASSGGILVFGGPCYGGPYTTGVSITKNTLTNNDVGVFLSNVAAGCSATSPTSTKNSVINNTITNSHTTNVSGNGSPNGYQAGVSDFGNHDNIVNNRISGNGYDSFFQPTPGSLYTQVDASGSTKAHVNNNG
jgi:hypothetical protein